MDSPSPRAEWESRSRDSNGNPTDPFNLEDPLLENPEDNNDPDPPQPKARPPSPPERESLRAKLFDELCTTADSNPKFEAFTTIRIAETADILVRNGIPSLEAFRTTDEMARRFLFEDLRKCERLQFSQLAFLFKLARHIPPHDQKVSEKNIRFTELDIPRALADYTPSLAAISSFALPDQDMVNWVNKEIAIANSKDPPYQPYLVPKLSEAPWIPPDSDHSTARTRWLGHAKQAKRPTAPQELSIQCFALYQLRFLIAADLCQAFSTFGGIAPQLAHLSTVLHISITDSVGTALAYRRILASKLQEKARKRTTLLAEFTTLLASENFTIKEQAKKEIAMAIDADQRAKDPPKGKGKNRKGDAPPLTNRQFRRNPTLNVNQATQNAQNSQLYNVDQQDAQPEYYRRAQNRSRTPARQHNAQQHYGPRSSHQQNKGKGRRPNVIVLHPSLTPSYISCPRRNICSAPN